MKPPPALPLRTQSTPPNPPPVTGWLACGLRAERGAAVAAPHFRPALCRGVRAACGLRGARAGHEATARTAPAHPIDPAQPAPSYGLACLRATGGARGGCSRSTLPPCALSWGPCCLRAFLLEVAFFALPPTTPGRGSKNAQAATLYVTAQSNIMSCSIGASALGAVPYGTTPIEHTLCVIPL